MIEEQVVGILGDPTFRVGFQLPTHIWMSGPDVITITLDGEGKVSAKGYNPHTVAAVALARQRPALQGRDRT